ncbi:hypothetical protein NBO_2g0001 [Nosema bombycis CQ1]|uniref:Uncharacterized protein n=1 Tax=Nosema bombycis (strain CQ1 / CVCC 102059) TaxID=578461 RepID=R0MC19_NOSB1|nr:hypothetical protein NBO_2g0001 [Nosema bombycis CQ1]|eukprot:EOB15509.1 hypothetical protein NBO_2g0001 [Nosema bombycis CQ1]
MVVDRYVGYLQQSENFLSHRNFKIDAAFTSYFESYKFELIIDKSLHKKNRYNLILELQRSNFRSLLYTLLFKVKESGSTGPKGVITCALLMLYGLPNDRTSEYTNFLILIILAHNEIVLVNSQPDSDSKVEKIRCLKCFIYKKMCDILFPETKSAKYEEILHLTEKFNKKNYWFNEPSVILLMQYINSLHMTELDYIFRRLNNYKTTDNNKMNELVAGNYLFMFNLFHVENILVDKTSRALFSI